MRSRPALMGAGAVLIVLLAFIVTWLVDDGHRPPIQPGEKTTSSSPSARFEGTREAVADNNDPVKTGCASDPTVTTIDSVNMYTAANNLLGTAELRYSPLCRVAWGRFMPSGRLIYLQNATVTITAKRPGTDTVGTPYRVRFDGQAVYGNILITKRACVEITVTIDAPTGGGIETTRCAR